MHDMMQIAMQVLMLSDADSPPPPDAPLPFDDALLPSNDLPLPEHPSRSPPLRNYSIAQAVIAPP